MTLKPLSFAHAVAIADLWKEAGGSEEVEIGALEPLLWRDGPYRIHDLVGMLTKRGFVVSMTTNGQLLDMYAAELVRAGLRLIRTSWHSTDPILFREISGGYGNYERFLAGINLSLQGGIQIAFNRVLLKGCTDDIETQLDFIGQHRSKLKLYTLMWTPKLGEAYNVHYADWRPVVRKHVLPRTAYVERKGRSIGRKRIAFHLARGGLVEVKLGDAVDRSKSPCSTCDHKDVCEEGFGDYVRVDPRLALYLCYMRRDIGFPIQQHFGNPESFLLSLQGAIGPGLVVKDLLRASPLRLTVMPACNFNCRVPGTDHGWCMEEPGEYKYPRIRKTFLPGK